MGVLAWLLAVFSATASALVLDTAETLEVVRETTGTGIPLGVALFAGVMTMIGHSGILIINRVRGVRFIAALALTGLLLVGLYAAWASLIIGLGRLFLDQTPDAALTGGAVMMSAAPLSLGFCVLIPYSGPFIARALQFWSFLILVGLLQPLYGIGFWTALALAGLSWTAMQLAGRLLAHPLDWLLSRAWRLATGHSALLSARDVLAGHPVVELDGASHA